MNWIKLILQVLAGFFGWQKNKTDPEWEFLKRHEEWETQLRRLEDATQLAVNTRENYIAVCPSDDWDDDTFERLCNEADQASTAERRHRAREPQRGGD